MLAELYKRAETREMATLDPYVEQYVVEPVVENGIPTRITQLKKVCVGDNFKQFSATDFDVQSIIAVGAVHLLKPVSMRNTDVQSFADNVDMISSELDKTIQNANETVQA